MTMAYLLALAAMTLSLCCLMAFAWGIQQRTGNSGWVDTIWTYSVGLVGVVCAVWPLHSGSESRQWLVAALVLLWSFRLGTHLARRSVRIDDDPRYARYAEQWGGAAVYRMFLFLQAQALASVPLVFAVFVAAHAPVADLRTRDYVGCAILLVSIAGEAVADSQLTRFRADPAHSGGVCDAGLWSWSRHPNYFFEWLGWWAYPVMALSPDYPWGWAGLAAPAMMYWILVRLTGIPPLEQQMLQSRGQRYRDYQARTSQFFPLPPSQGSAA